MFGVSTETIIAADVGASGFRSESYIGPMRAVVQRVGRACVSVDGEDVGTIDRGIVVLVCVAEGDGQQDAAVMASKLARLRIFPDEQGRMNKSVVDIGGAALVVSQFTLCADVRKGNRPSFSGAAEPGHAEHVIEGIVGGLAEQGLTVATGVFGAKMVVSLDNVGPVTMIVEVVDGRIA